MKHLGLSGSCVAALVLASASTASAAEAASQPPVETAQRRGARPAPEPETPATDSFVYVDGGPGLSYIDLTTLNSSDFALGNAGGVGGMVDLGVGLRLVIFTLGPRVRYHTLSAFEMWQINGEFAMHVPVRKWDGYVGLHGGYSYIGHFSRSAFSDASSTTPSEDLRVRGWDVGLQVGLDYYFSHYLSVGGGLSGEILFLRRPALATAKDPQFGVAGGAVGFGLVATLDGALHF